MEAKSQLKKAFEQMQIIEFADNYNNKLYCDIFTTIRLKSPKYKVGELYRIQHKKKHHCVAQILQTITYKLNEIPTTLTLIDCGLDYIQTAQLIANLYTKLNIDWSKQQLQFIHLKKVKL